MNKLVYNFRDALLHIPLFAAYAGAAYVVARWLDPVLAAAVIGVLMGYLREVTQAQAKHDNRIWTGWKLTLGSTIEWVLPGVVVIGAALVIL